MCVKSAVATRDGNRSQVLATEPSMKEPSHARNPAAPRPGPLWKVSSARTRPARKRSQRNDGLIWWFYSRRCGSRFNALSSSRGQPAHDEKLIRASVVPRISGLLRKFESNESKKISIINIPLTSIYFGVPPPKKTFLREFIV